MRLWPEKARVGRVAEYSATSPDPLRAFAGPVPVGPVDPRGLGINVFDLPRANNAGELLWFPIVLAVAVVPRNEIAYLRGIRQYLSIAARFPISPPQREAPAFAPLVPIGPGLLSYTWEKEILHPAPWEFQDGYIKWHLSHRPGEGRAGDPRSAEPTRGLGTFYDLRFPWREDSPEAGYDGVFKGQDTIILWAEVLQPTAPVAFVPNDPTSLLALGAVDSGAPDVFVQAIALFNASSEEKAIDVKWYRIAGALILEHQPR